MTLVSLEHIRQLQDLLLRMRHFIRDGAKQRAEQVGYDHMALTSKGPLYRDTYADGIDLPDPLATRLVHVHFRDLTYNFLAGHTTLTATDVIARFDEQLARYSEFLAEHDAPPAPAPLSTIDALKAHLRSVIEANQLYADSGESFYVGRIEMAEGVLRWLKENES